MYPHERSLVEKLADKPFVIVGVNSDKDRERLEKRYGAARFAELQKADVGAMQKQAEEMLERVQRDFADVAWTRGTVGERAGADLFEMHNLAVGMVAPDIEAEDLAGTTFKLSDYRGKVVMIDFWGNW